MAGDEVTVEMVSVRTVMMIYFRISFALINHPVAPTESYCGGSASLWR